MGDIDHFKKLNDTYGHLAGNNLLSKVAHLIKANVRIADLVARFGGEEFVIVMPNTDAIGAEIVAEKIRKVVEAESFLIPGKEIMPVTISFGVVAYPTEAKTKEELLGHADDALLAAKKAGRNRTKTYTSVVTMDSIGDIT
jgi:diguanylate cyclase (GGDEF)-like protein